MLKNVLIYTLLITSNLCYSQSWLEDATDDKGRVDFFEAQKLFEEYWKDKSEDKGKGIKPFRRWEDFWSKRVDSKGNFPPPNINAVEWEKYLQLKGRSSEGSRFAGSWSSLGPNTSPGGYGGNGRISAIAFHPTNPSIIFVGTPGGGLWKTTNGGDNWSPIADNILAHLGVSEIVIHPTDPNIIYIASGDDDGSDTYSLGVLKSTDGGVTWNTTGLNWALTNYRRIKRMIMDPNDSNVLIAATTNGIYRTTNAGTNWTQETTVSTHDIVAHPTAITNIFYATASTGVFKSTDNGDNFSQVYTITGSNRINIAVSPANPNCLYAVASKSSDNGFNGLYRSIDEGLSFTVQSTTPNILGYNQTANDAGGQGWYDLCIAVDPLNADIVYIGGVNIWKSINGGASWTLNTFWYNISGYPTVHADKHLFVWENNTTLWNGNDGGIYKTTNGGTTWTEKSNTLVISQIYRIGAAQTDIKVIAGLQDNGTKLRSTAGNWSDVVGGDGMECNINPQNSSIQYGCIQYGNLQRTTNNWSSSTNIRNTIRSTIQGAWITPHQIDPTTPSTIYVAYDSLYRSINQGTNWTVIGTLPQIGPSKKTLLKIAPSNSNVIYVGISSNIYRTENGGTSWTKLSLPGVDISSIAIHPTKPLTIWVTRSNYSANSKVYKSSDGGMNWVNISGTLPNLPVNVVIHNNQLSESLYIGMDVGVFYLNNDLQDWIPFSDGLPNVENFDLDINYNTNTIYSATYGRGLWSSSLFTPAAVTCNAVTDIVPVIGYQSVNVSWSNHISIPQMGYEISITTSATPPASGIKTFDNNYFIAGLLNNTTYYIHIRALCSSSSSSIWKTMIINTPLSCGNTYVDSGGTGGNYVSNQDITRMICAKATNGAHQVTATFTTPFNVEANYDALYIHNGNSILTPLFASTNPQTLSGYPAGGYYGTIVPGTFTSTNTNSCLTTRFISDGSTTGSGYVTLPITCSTGCSNVISSSGDSGLNSLRDALSCLPSGSNVFFDSSLNGSQINLSSGPILLDKDCKIFGSFNNPSKISSTGNLPIFDIAPGINVLFENIEFTSGPGSFKAIQNKGNVTLRNVTFKDPNLSNSETIGGTGTVTIKDSVRITKI